MMELAWTPEAIQDRNDIYDYIEPENLVAALTLDELIPEKVQWLTRHPDGGRLGRVPETRELIIHPSYMLVYELVGEQVRVLNVVHTARQWPPSRT
ncbi:type II toxin-antitoxin system RelE/ParE family toxin [Halomonas pacifica]|uniref:type II toxin-antitoxin system RelE/ParE family toxin n=1 Tax=Bisbaumannia pacifica TaxID=77098 RepID=UPI0023593DF5|nr:type II toxin-antitoxin system RelE/ParE family toxin [Halomonas pacifica]MDC8802644.1 type II toxin-antitoxin system RelE/ParE family toxin [Halomonas pacifica]